MGKQVHSEVAAGTCLEPGLGPGILRASSSCLSGDRGCCGPAWPSEDLEPHFHASSTSGTQCPRGNSRAGGDLPDLVLTLCVTWSKVRHVSEPQIPTNGQYLFCCEDRLMPSKVQRPRRPRPKVTRGAVCQPPHPTHVQGQLRWSVWGDPPPSPPRYHCPRQAGATHLIFRHRIHGRYGSFLTIMVPS